MKRNILKFVNELEGFKTAIKNLHWSSSNMSEHKLFDEIASSVSDIQDEVSEMEQGMNGQVSKNELKPVHYKITNSKAFLSDLLKVTENFYATIEGKKYIGVRSSIEAFIGELNKFQYLLNLCLKEDKVRYVKKNLSEDKLHHILHSVIQEIKNNKGNNIR